MRMPKPAGRDTLNQRGTFNRHLGAVSGREDGAWCQVIHGNPLAAELPGKISHPIPLCGLGAGIDHHLGMRAHLLDTSYRQDAPPTAFRHGRYKALQKFKRCAQIYRDLLIEMRAADILISFWQFDGSVEHKDINCRPGRDRCGQKAARIIAAKILPKGARNPA